MPGQMFAVAEWPSCLHEYGTYYSSTTFPEEGHFASPVCSLITFCVQAVSQMPEIKCKKMQDKPPPDKDCREK